MSFRLIVSYFGAKLCGQATLGSAVAANAINVAVEDRWATANWLSSAIFLGLAILFFLFRKPIAKGILRVILAGTKSRHPNAYELLCKEMISPLGFLFPAIFLSLSVSLAGFISEPWMTFFVRVVDSVATIVAFWLLYKTAMFVGILVMRRPTKSGMPIGVTGAKFVVSMIRVTIIVIGVFILVSLWVKNVTGLVTGLGIGGLAISLAAQDSLANFLGSLALLFDEPFKVGDWIETKNGEGVVEEVGLRSSKVRSFDGALISMPNKELANATITNHSNREIRRTELAITLPWEVLPHQFDEFVSRVKEMLTSCEAIDTVQLVELRELKPEGMDLYIRYLTGPQYEGYWQTRSDINRGIMQIAEEMKIHLYIPNHVLLMGEDKS